MNKIIDVKNLTVTYDGKKVLENISFGVEEGDFLVIFGENGSGKSTLIKTLLSLKQPSGGEIIFAPGMRKSGIGYLPQMTAVQKDFPASVKEVVLSGCLNKMGFMPFYNRVQRARAKKYMELLGIAPLYKRCFRDLSGGQQQRVLLARALMAAEKLLLLDEPVSGMDPAATLEFYDAICKINKMGTAVIMVSHDVHSALSAAKHILHIGQKKALFYGSAQEYEISSISEEDK